MADPKLKGTCKVLYCWNIARRIDLRRAQELLQAPRRTTFHHKTRVPAGAALSFPLRLAWSTPSRTVGRLSTTDEVEIAFYDMGTVAVTWDVPFEATLDELVELSATLYDHADLTERSRELALEMAAALGPALDRPRSSTEVEDYVVFQVAPCDGNVDAFVSSSRDRIARILRAEVSDLARQEVDDALAHPISYGRDDLCLVDWLAAFLLGSDTEDERFVLELATVELLELRMLDAHLSEQVEDAYRLFARRRGLIGALTVQRRELEHLGRIQADDALLHEGVDNALKLLGDDYLARLYRTAAGRFHFDDWDGAIQRKLDVLRTVHQSLSDLASHRRSEILEWIIIVLIAVDIAIYFQ